MTWININSAEITVYNLKTDVTDFWRVYNFHVLSWITSKTCLTSQSELFFESDWYRETLFTDGVRYCNKTQSCCKLSIYLHTMVFTRYLKIPRFCRRCSAKKHGIKIAQFKNGTFLRACEGISCFCAAHWVSHYSAVSVISGHI